MSDTVLITTADIGIGHFTRARMIAERLKRDGVEIHFCLSKRYLSEARKQFKNVHEVPGLSWLENSYGVDMIRSFLNILIPTKNEPSLIMKFIAKYRAIRTFCDMIEPDVVISDGDIPTLRRIKRKKEQQRRRKEHEVKCVFNTNTIRPDYPYILKLFAWLPQYFSEGYMKAADKITFADLPPGKTISAYSLGDPRKFSNLEFVGPFTDMRRQSGIEDDRSILVLTSGTEGNRKRFYRKVQHIMDEFCRQDDRTWTMALGLDVDYYHKNDVHEVFGYLDEAELKKRRAKCGLVLHNGSINTTFEAIACEKASIVIPTNNQLEQVGNARRVEELGLGVYLPEKRLNELPFVVRSMDQNRDGFTRRLERFREYAEGFDGLEETVKYIKSFL